MHLHSTWCIITEGVLEGGVLKKIYKPLGNLLHTFYSAFIFSYIYVLKKLDGIHCLAQCCPYGYGKGAQWLLKRHFPNTANEKECNGMW